MSYLLHKSKALKNETNTTTLQSITPTNCSLDYIQFKVMHLIQDDIQTETLDGLELCLVILEGKVTVQTSDSIVENIGTRHSIFEKIPTDSYYIPLDNTFTLHATTPTAKVAFCYSPTTNKLEPKLIQASQNSIEHRGIYNNKRLVHNILPDTSSISDSLLVVEVYTSGGNFSSYPPHKHDQDNLPLESLLEETYYHEINPSQGFVFQRIYTDDREIDETMSVESGDVVVVPKGYHPVGVPDGYEGYYLNVMAGPTKKWAFVNDADHEWILDRK